MQSDTSAKYDETDAGGRLTGDEGASLDRRLAEGQARSRDCASSLRSTRTLVASTGRSPADRSPSALLERYALEEASRGEVEPDLVCRAKAGDTRAREELINRLLPLVIRLARPYRTPGIEWEDLIQEGAVGLLRALASFDPEAGVPFPAYAVWWVRYGLQDLRSQFIRPLRLPPKALRRLAALKEAHERIYRQEHRNAGAGELGRAVGLSLADTEALLRADRRCRSLEEPSEEGAEVGTLGELLADPLSEEAYEEVLFSVQADELRVLLTHLSGREQEVLAARYGLDGREEETLREVGDRLGISAERVRQLEDRALTKLRQSA